jgi:hypothetical protein
MDINRCEPLIGENAPVILDAQGKISEDDVMHHPFSALEVIGVTRRE